LDSSYGPKKNESILYQSILEVTRDGNITNCFGTNCEYKAKAVNDILEQSDLHAFQAFLDVIDSEDTIGLESYFIGNSGKLSMLTFMGRRSDILVLLHSEIYGGRTALFDDTDPAIIKIIDDDGNILFRNKAWNDRIGYREKNLNFNDLILPEYKVSYQNFLSNLKPSDSGDDLLIGLEAESGQQVFLECKHELKMIDGKKSFLCLMKDITDDISTIRQVNDQSARIKAFFRTGNILFWSVNRNKSLTSFNDAYSHTIKDLYGVVPEINTDLSKPKQKFASKEYHSFWDEKYDYVFRHGEGINFTSKTTDLKGQTSYRDIYLNPILINEEVKEVAGLALDVTEQKVAAKNIQDQSKKINTIFNATNHMIWSVNEKFELTFFNEFYEQGVSKRFNTEVALGKKVYEMGNSISKSRRAIWKERYQRAFQGEQLRFESEYKDAMGKEHTAEVSFNPIFDDEGNIIEVAGISQAVTYKKAAEKKLKAQAAKIQAIFDSTAMLIWTVDTDYHIVSYNRIFADQHFKLLDREVSIGSNFIELLKNHLNEEAHGELDNYFKLAFKGKMQQFEGRLPGQDGNEVWMEVFLSPIVGEDSKIKEISCMSYDVTDKKIIQKKMKESLSEKEILLQEVHHRVKNNLQVISSILNLQSSYVKDENSLNILRESQNRIKSMSFIHESLYQTKDFSGIEFSGYILSLANNLVHSYSLEVGMVNLKTDLDDTYLSLDQAIPCGLIANELISNSLKYAFDKGQPGEIFVSAKHKGSKVSLTIADNGRGLPEGFDYENSDSLGLQLVYTLKDQLDASIEVSTKGGTKYLITFERQ
jgi:PAS domain S-box-containing protein